MPDNVAIPGSDRIELQGATLVGSVPDEEVMSASIAVRERPDGARRRDELSEGTGPAQPGVSDEEFASVYGAAEADIQAVVDFARSNGFTVDSASALRRTVRITGTARQFQDVFGTTLRRYQYEGQTFRGRTGPLEVPAELAPIIVGVFGIDSRPIGRRGSVPGAGTSPPAQEVTAPEDSGSTSLTAPQVATAYNFPSGVTGTGQTIALPEFGGGYTASDLSTYFAGLGLTVPSVTDVSVLGATNSPGSTGDVNTVEVTLDVEIAGAVAQGASIVVYFAPNTSDGWWEVIQRIVTDTTINPSVASISWGSAQDTAFWTQQLMTQQLIQQLESSFAAAAAKKMTVFAASGDQGSSDGQTDGLAHVQYPASSSNVTGCGGSVLTLNGSAIATEVVWNNADGSTGGGVSSFPLPSWQSGAGVPVSANPGGTVGRGVPDVCGHADSYQIFVGGASSSPAGTSAAAPLWAGLTALINQQLSVRVGLLNPQIYQSSVASAFHDVTSGSNGAYSAGPGWDPCTGLGSPDGSALATALQALTTPAPVVTGVSPASGSAAGGDSVTVTGSGFTGATGVGFGSADAAAMTVDSDTQITATSPAGTGTVDVTVTTPAGTSAASSADQFTYM